VVEPAAIRFREFVAPLDPGPTVGRVCGDELRCEYGQTKP
jgi:hypothetical protein